MKSNTSWPVSKLKKICTTWFGDNKELMERIADTKYLKSLRKDHLEEIVKIVNGSSNPPIGS